MYSGQVNRLSGDIASLRSRLADERKRLADANGKALRAVEAVTRATSASQLRTKTRDVERHQQAAASHEKKVADLEGKIASKHKSLASAQANLDRATRDQQKRDDREAEKRRRTDLDHIQTMERNRRSTTYMPEMQARPAVPVPQPTGVRPTERYDVCLSFAGEQRDYVERIATALKEAGLKVFYDQDKDIAARLWGTDLGEYLDYVYREGSRFCLMFVSADYAQKAWTTHERRSALARAIDDGGEYVLPARFDDTELPGFRPTIGYVDLRQIAPATLVDFVLTKLTEATPEAAA